MTNCKHHNICGLETLNNKDECCILHSHDPNKDKSLFEKFLNNHILKDKNTYDPFDGLDKTNKFNIDPWNMSNFIFNIPIKFSDFIKGENKTLANELKLYNAEFLEEVDFSECTFKVKVNFKRTNFKKKADFNNSNFIGSCDFEKAFFEGEVDFFNCIFEKNINFNISTFEKSSSFHSSKFKKPCDFKNINFIGMVNFSEVEFDDIVNFNQSIFQEESKFERVTFKKNLLFHGVKFKSVNDKGLLCSFSHTEFYNSANFSLTEFDSVFFDSTIFKQKVIFNSTKFTQSANFQEANFEIPITFFNTEFSQGVNLTESTIQSLNLISIKCNNGNIEFNNSKIKNVFIKNCTFNQIVSFQNINFSGQFIIIGEDKENTDKFTSFFDELNFNGSTFEKSIQISNTEINNINLKPSKFEDKVVFKNSKFNGNLDLSNIDFPKEAIFDGSEFHKEISFNSSTFNEKCSFLETTFINNVSFVLSKFNSKVNFSSKKFIILGQEKEISNFQQEADFSKVEFYDEADFSNSIFNNTAIFYKSTFSLKMDFSTSKFKNKINLKEAKFEKEVNFSGVEFNSVEFMKTKFENGADFSDVTFNTDTKFEYSVFKGSTSYFINTKAKKDITISFKYSQFLNRVIFSNSDDKEKVFSNVKEVDFSDLILEPLKSLVFINVDLSKSSFLNTDLREAEFTNVEWNKDNNLMIYDERKKPDNYTKLEKIYRDLKINYENRKDFYKAGEFHINEKRIKRLNPETTKGNKFILFFYFLFSNYGESVKKPSIGLIIVLILSTFSYFFTIDSKDSINKKEDNIVIKNNPLNITNKQELSIKEEIVLHQKAGKFFISSEKIKHNTKQIEPINIKIGLKKIEKNEIIQFSPCKNFWMSLLHSVRVMLFMKPDLIKLNDWGNFFQTLEAILAPFFFALMTLAIRQRLKRF